MERLLKASAVLEDLGETNPEAVVGRRFPIRSEDGVEEYRLDRYLIQQDAFVAVLMSNTSPATTDLLHDLVEFLRARLDEDKLLALSAKCDGRSGRDRWNFADSGDDLIGGIVRDGTDDRVADDLYRVHALHIARHDPARVLREVEAKRMILERHYIVHRNIGWLEDGDEEYGEIPVCGLCVPKHSGFRRREDVPEGPCQTVRLLALPYADHPDYREEWRP